MRIFRFLSLALLFAVIACALFSVSAYAAEEDIIIDGTFRFNETIFLSDEDCVLFRIPFTSSFFYPDIGHVDFSGNRLSWTVVGVPAPCLDYGIYRVYYDGVWLDDSARIIHVDNYNLTAEVGDYASLIYQAFFANVEQLCDGSSCSAIDLNQDNFCDDCGCQFVELRDYTFTVPKFLSSIGQIFKAAISWVSKVGAAIVDQPLLLAFCALPLCGIGIGFFRRLRNAN